MSHTNQEATLVERARQGDGGALQVLFLRHHDRLLARLTTDFPGDLRAVSEPEDVLQVSYSEASDALHGFQFTGEGSFYAWISKIAQRNLTDLIRFHRAAKRGGRMNRLTTDPTSDDETESWYAFLLQESLTPSRAVAKEEAIAALRLAIAELKPDYRKVIELRYLKQLSEQDTAEKMGREVSTIHGLCFRATRKLRERMGRYSRYFSQG